MHVSKSAKIFSFLCLFSQIMPIQEFRVFDTKSEILSSLIDGKDTDGVFLPPLFRECRHFKREGASDRE